MSSTEQLRMKLAAILSTNVFDIDETLDLIALTQRITEDCNAEFHQFVSDKMREELVEIVEDEELDCHHLLETAVGYAAVLEWIDSEPQNLVHIVLEHSDTYASYVALQTLETCFCIAELGVHPIDFSHQEQDHHFTSSTSQTGDAGMSESLLSK